MPLDRIVLIIVAVGAGLIGILWVSGVLVVALSTPFAWLVLIPLGLALWIGWRVIVERLGNDEDDHYDRIPPK